MLKRRQKPDLQTQADMADARIRYGESQIQYRLVRILGQLTGPHALERALQVDVHWLPTLCVTKCPRAAPSTATAISHMWLFSFKLIKLNYNWMN